MPALFYFDETIVDDTGVRATTAEAAIQEAMEVIAEMRAAGEVDVEGGWDLVIRDAEGSTVKRLPIR